MEKADAWVMIPVAENNGKECSLDICPLVLCKNCKHYLLPDGESRGECMAKAGWFPVDADWFCADGERK